MMDHGPLNSKCYPTDNNMIHVTFNEETLENKIQYFIASDSPREFLSQLSMDVNTKSFKIVTKTASIFKPLKPFYLYMRNMMPHGTKMKMSRLSKPIMCATQGIEAKFVKAPSGIFLRWDTPVTDTNVTGYTIQFLNNKTSSPIVFDNELVGTFENWPTYVSWNDVDRGLQKISVRNWNKTNWTEVQVPGNVTGLLIINTEEINVRILGSVMENGELFDQDLKFLTWTNIKRSSISLEPLTVGEVDSRGAEILWSGLDNVQCAFMCSVLKNEIISRDSADKFKCEKM